ncbi:MAG: hypothetical protein K6E13_01310 [Lachnospiraceae bacterium]|nr:hypothetical protein [Lachnospiraceae bacterium]
MKREMKNRRVLIADKLNTIVLLFLMVIATSLTITLYSFADKEEANEQYGAPSILKEGDYYLDDYSCMNNKIYSIFYTYDAENNPEYQVYSWYDKREDDIVNVWHVFKMDLSGDGAQARLLFYNGPSVIRTEYISLSAQNLYYYSDEGFDAVELWVDSEDVGTFTVSSIEFREKKELFSTKQFACRYMMIFVGTAIVVAGIYISLSVKLKAQLIKISEGIEKVYTHFATVMTNVSEGISKAVPELRIGEKGISYLRSICFAIPFFGGCWPILSSETGNNYTISRLITVVSLMVCAMLLGLEPKEEETESKYTDLGKAVLVLGIMQFISDIFVPHSHRFNGLVLILFFIYFFAVGRVKDKDKIFQEIKVACHIFVVYLIWHLVFIYTDPYTDARFIGPYGSASECGISVVSFVALILIEIYNCLNTEKKRIKRFSFHMIELISLSYMIIKTDSRDSILAYGVIAAIFVAFLIKEKFNKYGFDMNRKRRWVQILTVIAIIICFMGLVLIYIIRHSHSMTGLSINKVSSARISIWRKAFSLLNFVGHDEKLTLMTEKFYIHNGIISQMFFYGIGAAVPYVYMFYALICNIARDNKLLKINRIWALTFIIGYINTIMLDVQDEFPFIRAGYLLSIYMIGFFI